MSHSLWIVQDFYHCVRTIYLVSDQLAVIDFVVSDKLTRQSIKEYYKVGMMFYAHSTTQLTLKVGSSTPKFQMQDEVLQDLAYTIAEGRAPNKLVHLDYLFPDSTWVPKFQTRYVELPLTDELDELANLL